MSFIEEDKERVPNCNSSRQLAILLFVYQEYIFHPIRSMVSPPALYSKILDHIKKIVPSQYLHRQLNRPFFLSGYSFLISLISLYEIIFSLLDSFSLCVVHPPVSCNCPKADHQQCCEPFIVLLITIEPCVCCLSSFPI